MIINNKANMKKCYLALLAVLLLAGCAVPIIAPNTTPVSTSESKPIPESRIFNNQLVISKAGYGEVVVKRDIGFLGSGCNTDIFIDGKLSAELATGEKVLFYLPEGRHIIGIKPINRGICGGVSVTEETEALVSLKQPLTFRIGIKTTGLYSMDLFINPTAF